MMFLPALPAINLPFSMPLSLLLFFLLLDLTALLGYLWIKQQRKQHFRRELKVRRAITEAIFSDAAPDAGTVRLIRSHRRLALKQLASVHGALVLNREERKRGAVLFHQSGITGRLMRELYSRSAVYRYAAALHLRFLLAPDNRTLLAHRLREEPFPHIRLALVKGLLDAEDPAAFDAITESLAHGGRYAVSVAGMLTVAGYRFIGWARTRMASDNPLYKRSILYGSRSHTTPWLMEFARKCLDDSDRDVRIAAAACGEVYPGILSDKAAQGAESHIRAEAIRIAGLRADELDIEEYCGYFEDEELFSHAVEGLQAYLTRFPERIESLLLLLSQQESTIRKRGLALGLASRIPFLLARRLPPDQLLPLIREALHAGQSTGIIAFLNGNRDQSAEKELIEMLKPLVLEIPSFRQACMRFLTHELRQKLELEGELKEENHPRIPLSNADRLLMISALLAIIILPVILLLVSYDYPTATFPLLLFARYSIRSFSALFFWYTLALHLVYLSLLLLAADNLIRQNRYWGVQDQEFLFTPGVVPSVAIIAPAYNEEQTVVESVNSLLTLIYPEYEVIVINDGSSDRTMEVLNEAFQLVRVDLKPSGEFKTAPVKGIYRSHLNRRLLIIDKVNGGKADALNCGIDYAGKEYICSIDSDSLLEPDSLLRMTTEILTSKRETIAVGGNILPVNGCIVEHGALQRIGLSRNPLVRMQTIEYLRAFIAGRLGWAKANSLLIISGAFGLFRRQRVMEIGGYLTGRGVHRRDTVGEDMELVVRLVRHMGRQKKAYRIAYAATANCWTEVPERLNSVYRQRDRWHRGLVEIITYHRGMILNPRYGTAGLIALPYFLIFELIGPFYELFGYIAMLIGFATGILTLSSFLLLFTAVVLFGALISLISLIMSEFGVVYFTRGEILRLIWITIIENLGYRQLSGWVRVFAFTSMIFTNRGWQKLERKGFTRSETGQE